MNKIHLLTRAFKALFPQISSFDWDNSNDDHDLIFKDDLVAITNVEEPPYKKIIKASNYINKLPALRSAINYTDPSLTDMNAVPRDLVLVVHGIITNDERVIELIEKLETTSEKGEIMKAVVDQSQNTKTPAPVVGAAIDDLIDAEDRMAIDRATASQLKILTTGFSFAKAAITFASKVATRENLEMETSSETIQELMKKRPVEAFTIIAKDAGVDADVVDAVERFSTLLEDLPTEPSDMFFLQITRFINAEVGLFFQVNDGVLTPNESKKDMLDALLTITNNDVFYVATLFKLLLTNLSDNVDNVGALITDAFYTAQLAEKMR